VLTRPEHQLAKELTELEELSINLAQNDSVITQVISRRFLTQVIQLLSQGCSDLA